MDILLALVVGAFNIVCFLIGAKVGQTVSNGETIQVPTLNPMQMYREHVDKREAEKEQKKIDAILRNIEVYDGTDRGQQDIPR